MKTNQQDKKNKPISPQKNSSIQQKIQTTKSSQNISDKQQLQIQKNQISSTNKNDHNISHTTNQKGSVQNSQKFYQENQIINEQNQNPSQKQNRSRRLYTFNITPQNDKIKSKQVQEIQNQLKQIESVMKRKSVIIQVEEESYERKSDKHNRQSDPNDRSMEHDNKDFTPPIHNQIAQDARRNTQILFIPNFSDVGRINEQEQKQFNSDSQYSDSDQYDNQKEQQKKNSPNANQNNEEEQQQKDTEMKQTKERMTPKFDNRQNNVQFTQTKSKPVIQPFNIERKQQQIKPDNPKNCKCNLI